MAYKPGEIYFVRESVLGSDTLSSFVKIGLVASPRTSDERLKEHQTGNPRRLKNQAIVTTGAVHRVEAMMHRIYAPHRVSGEWFDFKEEALLVEAIARVRSFADEVAILTPIFDTAAALANSRVADGAPMLPATPELETLAQRRSIAAAKVVACSAVEKIIKTKFTEAIAAGADTKGAAEEKEVFPIPKFSVTAFKKDHPDKYSQFLVVTSKYGRSYKFIYGETALEDLDADFIQQLAAIQTDVDKINSPEDAYLLNEPRLQVLQLGALAEWEFDVAEAELKVEVGANPGIEGICTWQGKDSTTSKFDSGRLAEEDPELYMEYTLTRESFKRLDIKRKKN
jgi:hypothetical protein